MIYLNIPRARKSFPLSASASEFDVTINDTNEMTSLVARLYQITVPKTILCATKPKVLFA